jgi:hypothetical protein
MAFIPASRAAHDLPVSELAGSDLYLSTIVDDPLHRATWANKQTCLFCSGEYRYSPGMAECHLDQWICTANTGKARPVFLCKPFPQHLVRYKEVLAVVQQRRSETAGCDKSKKRSLVLTGSGMEGDAIQLGDGDAGGGEGSSARKRPAGEGMMVCFLSPN